MSVNEQASSADQLAMKKLREIRTILRKIESQHRQPDEVTKGWQARSFALEPDLREELVQSLASLASTETISIRKLADLKRVLANTDTGSVSYQEFLSLMIPVERELRRSVRDDEFMITSLDRAPDQKSEPSDRLPHQAMPEARLHVILDNLRSAFNVGSIIRTTEAFGGEKVWLAGYTPMPDGDNKTSQTSMGADQMLQLEHQQSCLDAIAKLKSEGFKILALETAENAISVYDFEFPEKCAILLGNERFGLDPDTLRQADHVLKIPMLGQKNSLNVASAFAVTASFWQKAALSQARSTKSSLSLDTAIAHPTEIGQKQADRFDSFNYRPIGNFHCTYHYPYQALRQGSLQTDHEDEGYIELLDGHHFEYALEDLDGVERIWVIFEFDQSRKNWKPKTVPPRGAHVKRGVFATRSPYRPNPIGISCVQLIRIEGRKIFVRGFDLLDQTPILDIKPYLPYADSFPDAKTGWIEQTNDDAFTVVVSQLAKLKLDWLAQSNRDERSELRHFQSFLLAQLQFEPFDRKRKRVLWNDAKTEGVLAYRTWRARLESDPSNKSILVQDILSGYTSEELATQPDTYGDKQLHLEFTRTFPAVVP